MGHPKGNKTIGQNSSHTDTAELISSGIPVGNLAFVDILTKEEVSEGHSPHRMLILITVTGQAAWIKFEEANGDTVIKGTRVPKNGVFIMEVGTMYFGGLSAMAELPSSVLYIQVL